MQKCDYWILEGAKRRNDRLAPSRQIGSQDSVTGKEEKERSHQQARGKPDCGLAPRPPVTSQEISAPWHTRDSALLLLYLFIFPRIATDDAALTFSPPGGFADSRLSVSCPSSPLLLSHSE